MKMRCLLAVTGVLAFASLLPAQVNGKPMAESVNRHAFETFQLFRQITKGNFCFSPYSTHQVAALLAEGSKGETQAELLAVTHLNPMAQDRLAEAKALRDALTRSARQGVTFQISNSLWAPPDVMFLPTFQNMAKETFGAAVQTLPKGDAVASAAAVNRWVRQQTAGRIPALLGPSAFGNSDQTIVIVNAMYLKAAWATPFPPQKTKVRAFQCGSGAVAQLPTMFQVSALNYGDDAAWQCLEMPFVGADLRMLFLLPKDEPNRLRIEPALSVEALAKMIAGLADSDVNVMLPRFGFSTQLDMTNLWQALGIKTLFSPQKADLTAMLSMQPCSASQVVHEATIEVNEVGAEATVATAVAAAPLGEPPEATKRRHVSFIANHPFLWMIQHKPSGALLFMGRYAGE